MRIAELGTPFAEKTVVALGFFDSIHIGHRDIIAKTIGKARDNGCQSVLFTFSNNPAEFFGSSNKLIYTFEERCDIIAELGMDVAAFARFDENFRDISPLEFMRLLLSLNPVCLVCGFDYSYGKGAEGKPETLRDFFLPQSIGVEIVEEIKDGFGKIGTTRIKGLLSEGKAEQAAVLLGEAYRMEGVVMHGYGVGNSRLGFPTANLSVPKEKHPLKSGVYAGRAKVDDKVFRAIINMGCRPTFDDDEIKAEAFLLDFDGNLYGKKITLFFDSFLRETKKFDNAECLKAQLEADRKEALRRIK